MLLIPLGRNCDMIADFSDLDEDGLNKTLKATGIRYQSEMWLTDDQRPGREDVWLNALLTQVT